MSALADRFGRRHTYLRLGLTERCNLRCVYCMPAHGVPLAAKRDQLSTDELVRVTRLMVGNGVDKVRLTGGEPLVRKDALEVARQVGRFDLRSLAITTNGLLLEDRLADLEDAGLTDLTVSLDTLRPERFEAVTRRAGLPVVLSALEDAMRRGYGRGGRALKVNVVALKNANEDEVVDFARWAASEPLEVRFIEVMPFAGNGWDRADLVPMAETRARIEDSLGPLSALDDGPHATAQTFAQPGWRGRVGFVASMTAPFCAGCNRLRVTADGGLQVCLFGGSPVSLRDAMRAGASDLEVVSLVRRALEGKHAAHAGMDALAKAPPRPMVAIGG
ncbi:GTP 3',8-cyclase MoaA [Rubrivirga sp.]|uniref:GTP 3',8-cyclase MoaA n=1 Tax=Rubrivirga sp. TaxID=1885344 RepID=UPI003C755119